MWILLYYAWLFSVGGFVGERKWYWFAAAAVIALAGSVWELRIWVRYLLWQVRTLKKLKEER